MTTWKCGLANFTDECGFQEEQTELAQSEAANCEEKNKGTS